MERKVYFGTQHKYLGDLSELGFALPTSVDQYFRDKTVGGLSHLGAAILGAHARQNGFEVSYFNSNDLFSRPKVRDAFVRDINDRVEIIAMLSAMDINSGDTDKLARLLPSERTIVGGTGPTLAPELFRGGYSLASGHVEGEIFNRILDDFSTSGRLNHEYHTIRPRFSGEIKDYPELNPEYSPLLSREWSKSLFAPLELSRGCNYSCDFCHTGLHKERIDVKPLNIVEEQLKLYKDNKALKWPFVIIYDQNMVLPYFVKGYGRDYLLDLAKLFKKYDVYWVGEGTLGDIVEKDDREVLKALGERCFSVLCGVENLFGQVEGAKGKSRLNNNFLHHVEVLKECKVPVMWSLIGGLDTQSADYFRTVVESVKKLGLPIVFHKAVARPGTPFYEQVNKEGRILSHNSRNRDMKFHAAHKPTGMTVNEALGGHAYVHAEIFNPIGIIQRFMRHVDESGLPFAVKSLIPEIHGLIVTPRLVHTYREELKKYKQEYVNNK